MSIEMMKGAPAPENAQVTLGNWRQAPFSRWGFCHVREVVPTARVRHDPNNVRTLDTAPRDILTIPADTGNGAMTVEEILNATDTDGLAVLHEGTLVTELYRRELARDVPHIVFSVTKSVTAILAGILCKQGVFDADAALTRYIPELDETAYGDASVRHLLDMTTGIEFDEDYLATEGAIVRYREATGWNPGSGSGPADLRSFLLSLAGRERPHGEVFRYLSPNSDLLGWAIERASGERIADILGKHLWQPMGAETDADITVDPLGAARTAGGFCPTLRDLARFGQLLLDGGVRDSAEIVPPDWIRDIRENGDPDLWARGDFASQFPPGMRYRSQWYVLGEGDAAFFGLGIHGQYIYIDPAARVVIAKMSSQAEPLDEAKDNLCLAMFSAICRTLAG